MRFSSKSTFCWDRNISALADVRQPGYLGTGIAVMGVPTDEGSLHGRLTDGAAGPARTFASLRSGWERLLRTSAMLISGPPTSNRLLTTPPK